MENLPKYIKIEGSNTAMRLVDGGYYRDGGQWWLSWKIVGGSLLSRDETMPWLNNKRLIEITEEEWRKDNLGYV